MTAVARTVFTLILVAIATLCTAIGLVLVGLVNPASPWMDRIAAAWARTWLLGLGLHPEIEFETPLTPGGSFVVVGNHQSNLDPMCHYLSAPSPLRYLAKTELYKVPVFGQAIRAIGMIEVDRSNPSMNAINRQVDETVERGRSIIVYAEGRRSKTGELGPFKKGAFVIAIQTGLPIVPVAISGTGAIWPPGAKLMRPGPITVRWGTPIPTDGMTLDDVEPLRDRVREWIEAQLTAGG
jgi:1-acyl-sn-glycerol-3-phosphate acyltransferase